MVQKLKCPKCGSENIIDNDRFDIEFNFDKVRAYYIGYCQNCETVLKWAECFTFEGFDEIEED